MIDAKQLLLPNGLRVLVVEEPRLRSAHLCYVVRCGSRHETSQTLGLSHLLEHMVFRGSQYYPSTQRLAHAFERFGGTLEGATWRDHTAFSSTLHPDGIQSGLHALSDMLIQPTFAGLDIERQVVEQELAAELDEYDQDIDLTNLSRAQLWPNHPMGQRILGSKACLQQFSRADLQQHHANYYTASQSVLSICGNIDSQQVFAWAADYFAAMPKSAMHDLPPEKSPLFAPKTAVWTQKRDGTQLEMQLSYQALPDVHDDFVALMLLCGILDDGFNSRLPNALTDQQGLVYELSSGLDCYNDCGIYDITMQTSPHKAAQAIATTLDILQQVCQGDISTDELNWTKKRHLIDLQLQLDSSEDIAQAFATSVLFGRPHPFAATATRLQQVTLADINRVAQQVLGGNKHLSVLGPFDTPILRALEQQL